MSKDPACLVVPIRSESVEETPLVPPLVPIAAQPRETSWRDLVRRLSKTPAKR